MFEPINTNRGMIPAAFPRDIEYDWCRQPERRFFKRMSEDIPSGWTCIYSQRYTRKRMGRLCDGEIDFLVFVPSKGILVIELKGGVVEYDASQKSWYQRHHEGITKGMVKIDPEKQALNGKHAIIDLVKTMNLQTGWRIHHAIALPDSDFPAHDLGLEVDRNLIIDRGDMEDLPGKIEAILDYAAGTEEPWAEGPAICGRLLEKLTMSWHSGSSLKFEIENEKQFVDMLSEEQNRVLSELKNGRRILVKGCAGSGKTLLALNMAEQLARAGKRTLLTCYNRALAEHLKHSIGSGYKNLEIINFHGLCKRATGRLQKNVIESQKGWDCYMPMFLRQYMHENPAQKYDAILVDELQDFDKHYWEALLYCLKDQVRSSIFAFSDCEQSVRVSDTDISKELVSFMDLEFELKRNHRNTKTIFNLISRFYDSSNGYICKGPPGRKIGKESYETKDEFYKRLDSVIAHLVHEENVPLKDIIILEQSKQLLKDCTLPCGIKLIEKDSDSTSIGISYTTIRKFKGLEKPVVILAGLDHRLGKSSHAIRRNLLYVASSRASSHLILIGTPAGFRLMKDVAY
ncbi:MAG: AAA family ATPase [Candidatus Obscuribacterales bacterium]